MRIKDVNGFSLFLISDEGILYKKTNGKIKIVKLFHDKDGYLVTKIQQNKKRISIKVHRLVFSHFMDENIENKEINHIDGNKKNNKLSNLEIVSRLENMRHALNNGFLNNAGEKNGNSKLSEDDVIIIKKLLILGVANKVISKLFSIKQNTVSDIKNDKLWRHVKVK